MVQAAPPKATNPFGEKGGSGGEASALYSFNMRDSYPEEKDDASPFRLAINKNHMPSESIVPQK